MIPRHISSVLFDPLWGKQVRYLLGPRSSGKTTLIKSLLPKDWTFLDEIHLGQRWSDDLRRRWEGGGPNQRIVAAGSAHVDLLPYVSRNLEGLTREFHLFPLSLTEALEAPALWPGVDAATADAFLERRLANPSFQQEVMERLLKYSGFPDSFLNNRAPVDLDDLQPLAPKLKTASMRKLIALLAEKIGQPVSTNGLKEASGDTYHQINNGLELLHLGYVTFEIRSYAKKMPKELAKESKIYLFNWTWVPDETKRFENYVAHELNALIHLWNDAGLAHFELRTLRQQENQETDFLIVRERKPWLLLEASLTAQPLENHHKEHALALGGVPIVQIVKESNIVVKGTSKEFKVSASRFFC